MDVSSTAGSPVPAPPKLPAPANSTASSDASDRGLSLANTVLDTSGKYSDDERQQAYIDLTAMKVTGHWFGQDPQSDELKLVNQATSSKTDIAQRSLQLSRQFGQAAVAAIQSGGAAAAAKAMFGFYDGLSSADQKLFFATSLSPVDLYGATRYANPQAWRDEVNAIVQGSSPDTGVESADGAPDPNAAVGRPLVAKDNTSATWSQLVLRLFGSDEPKDKIDLSDGAKKLVGDLSGPAPGSTSSRYKEGSIASTTA